MLTVFARSSAARRARSRGSPLSPAPAAPSPSVRGGAFGRLSEGGAAEPTAPAEGAEGRTPLPSLWPPFGEGSDKQLPITGKTRRKQSEGRLGYEQRGSECRGFRQSLEVRLLGPREAAIYIK
jgi:hypothetical protein